MNLIQSLKKLFNSIRIGDVDVTKEIIELDFLVKLIDEYIDKIFEHNPSLKRPPEKEVNELRQKVIERLKEKYPNSGIQLKK